jgi:hypothetical protein
MSTQCHAPPSVKVWDVKGKIKGPIIEGKIGCSMGDSLCIFPWMNKQMHFFMGHEEANVNSSANIMKRHWLVEKINFGDIFYAWKYVTFDEPLTFNN